MVRSHLCHESDSADAVAQLNQGATPAGGAPSLPASTQQMAPTSSAGPAGASGSSAPRSGSDKLAVPGAVLGAALAAVLAF